MTAIWQNNGSGWRLLASTSFPDEAALHRLVEQAPQVLPLAGAPSLVVVGSEVQLGNGYADLIAVEPSGRLVVLEIKLSRNSEARRAVVAQALTYAAYLQGQTLAEVEENILRRHLLQRGYTGLAGAVAANIQDGAFDITLFARNIEESIGQGRFRLVFVLDSAPEELVRLVAYLQSLTDLLVIDLITMASYSVGDSQILVPQRVEAERKSKVVERSSPSPLLSTETGLIDGSDAFSATIASANPEHQQRLQRLVDWARSMEREGLVRLKSYQGRGRWTLLPWLLTENAGLVTIWNANGASLSVWRSVFERRAPVSLPRVEQRIHPASLGQGSTVTNITEELLEALTKAYREAVTGKIIDTNE
jgi:hypothetical protein